MIASKTPIDLVARLTLACALPLLAACQQTEPASPTPMTERVQSDLAALEATRIFFGHQSVGANVLAGLEDLQRESGRKLTVIEHGDGAPLPDGFFFLHSKVGKNEAPATKCDDFRRIIDEQLGESIDIAMLKFCYIDINEQSDVTEMFAYYRTVVDDLIRRHPGITFVHVTAPLRHTARGFGVWAREMMGRPNRSKLANIKRNQFNELLRETYAGEPIFDIAASQSTYPDGRREAFDQDGKTYYSLIGAYTDDGGHLNAVGRTWVAADMLRSLADVAARRQTAAN